jgi:hypothetical protein
MGACYDVRLKVKLKDEKCAILKLREHIKNDIRTNYSLSEYSEEGITTETFDNLMRIFLAGWKEQEVKVREANDGFKVYENSFNASYGWERVMLEMFEVLVSYMEDKSTILIYADNGYDELVVKNGMCVQIY